MTENAPKSSGWRPNASSKAVQRRMARQKRRDTAAEIKVRRALHAQGVRFRVNTKLEPGLRATGDITWKGLKLVVFIDGCFWHGCPVHATRPKANAEWWAAKLHSNVARDRRTDAELRERGWTVLRFWEHESADQAALAICGELELLKASRSKA